MSSSKESVSDDFLEMHPCPIDWVFNYIHMCSIEKWEKHDKNVAAQQDFSDSLLSGVAQQMYHRGILYALLL